MQRWPRAGLRWRSGRTEKREDRVELPADEAQLRALYCDYFSTIYNYVARRVEVRADVDGVVHDVFMVAWTHLQDVPPAGDESKWWLLATARRVTATYLRGQSRRQRLNLRLIGEPGSATTSGEEHSGELLEQLRRLPECDQELIKLVYWDGLSDAEAALVLGQSRSATAVRLHRAKRKLRRLLVAESEQASLADRRGAAHAH